MERKGKECIPGKYNPNIVTELSEIPHVQYHPNFVTKEESEYLINRAFVKGLKTNADHSSSDKLNSLFFSFFILFLFYFIIFLLFNLFIYI